MVVTKKGTRVRLHSALKFTPRPLLFTIIYLSIGILKVTYCAYCILPLKYSFHELVDFRMKIRPHSSKIVVNFPDVDLQEAWSQQQLTILFQHRPDYYDQVPHNTSSFLFHKILVKIIINLRYLKR